jgi:hypothetical protein
VSDLRQWRRVPPFRGPFFSQRNAALYRPRNVVLGFYETKGAQCRAEQGVLL